MLIFENENDDSVELVCKFCQQRPAKSCKFQI